MPSSRTGEKVGIDVEVVERNPAQTGCVPIPRRWIVERAYGILMLHRRLVRDYEHQPRTSESPRSARPESGTRPALVCCVHELGRDAGRCRQPLPSNRGLLGGCYWRARGGHATPKLD